MMGQPLLRCTFPMRTYGVLLVLLLAALASACTTDYDCPDGCNAVGRCDEGECTTAYLENEDICCSSDDECPAQECAAAICNERGACEYFFKEGCVLEEPASPSPAFVSSEDVEPSSYAAYNDDYDDDYDYGYSPSSEPTVRNGCIYNGDTRIACAELSVHDCSSTWGFRVWAPISNSITHMILAEATDISVLQHSHQACYRLGRSACYTCIYLSDAEFAYSGDNASVSAHVQFTSQCDSQAGVYFLDFARVDGGGIACGSDGYEYLPCGEVSPYSEFPAPDLWDVIDTAQEERAVAFDFEATHDRSATSDSLRLEGSCVYYVHHSSMVLIDCFSVTYDTCSFNAQFVSTAGMDMQLPLLLSNHNGQEAAVMGCLPASDGSMACTKVEHIVRADSSLSIDVTMAVYRDETVLAGLHLGVFEYQFPLCGHRSTCTAEAPVDSPAASPTGGNTGGSNTGGNTGGNTGSNYGNHGNYGNYGNYGDQPAEASGGMSTFWVVFISVIAMGVTILVIGAVAVAVYLKRRRDSFSDPDTAYQLMIM